MNTQIIAIVNQKGDVGNTSICVTPGIALEKHRKKVLLLNADTQGSLTISWDIPDRTSCLFLYPHILNGKPIQAGVCIPHHPKGIDLVPASIEFPAFQVSLVTARSLLDGLSYTQSESAA